MVRVRAEGFGGAGRSIVEIRGEDERSGGKRFSPRCSLRSRGLDRWFVLGGVLLSRTLAGAVPSALSGLASGFGMDAGRFPVAVTTETTTWAVRGRRLWYESIRLSV